MQRVAIQCVSMYYVYLLKLNNNSIYTSPTPNLKERLREHIRRFCEAMKNLRPVKLVWFCVFKNRLAARKFVDYLKTGSGQAFRNRRLIT